MAQTKKQRPRIVVIGSLVFDFVAKADRLPRKGETILGSAFGMFSGGKGANQAVQAGRLGADVYMIGRVGDDFLADRVLSSLTQASVHTDFVKRDPSMSTAACCIHVDARGDNAIIIVPEANMACATEDVDVAREIIESADVLLCQLEIAVPTVAYAVSVAKAQGVPVILNPAPAGQVPDGLFSNVTVLTPNETEAEFFSHIPMRSHAPVYDENDAWTSNVSRKLLSMGPQTVILTLGEKGAYLTTRKRRKLVRGYCVSAVDATAAGDAFNGALAVALGEGKDIEAAVAFANAAGAIAATRPGAQPSLASRSELEEFVRRSENVP